MRRVWSIRARTALVFALASMALTAGVLVFVNVTAIRSISTMVSFQAPFESTSDATSADGTPHLWPSPGATAEAGPADGEPAEVVAVVATQQWLWSAVGVVGAGLFAGGLGWAVSRRMLRPIEHITDTTRRLSASTLHERIGLGGPDDELRRLSRTIDDLLDRLETAFESQRRFVAQASHELRTPLAVQRAAIQIGLHDGAGADDVAATRDELLVQNRRTEALVESLLVLAEAERGLDGRVEDIDLPALVDEVVSVVPVSPVGVRVVHRPATSPGAGGQPQVSGERTLVRQLLMNLVTNGTEYNRPGGLVLVTTDPGGFTVENTGDEVPVDVVDTLTEPFRRHAVTTTSGQRHSGLGLSIVRAIVVAHGWQLGITPRSGGGLRVRVGVSPE